VLLTTLCKVFFAGDPEEAGMTGVIQGHVALPHVLPTLHKQQENERQIDVYREHEQRSSPWCRSFSARREMQTGTVSNHRLREDVRDG
jgi:hypothetical protein